MHIIKTQQQIAVKQAEFASLISLESLRNIVSMSPQKKEIVNYAKTVDVSDLKDRESK